MVSPLLRVSVIGTSCSGKTTFARRLAAQFGYPMIELDALHWLPDWQERPSEDFERMVAEAVKADYWVLDGNYRQVRPLIWPRATHVIWLNYSFPLIFWRAVLRTVKRAATHEELFSGNRETWVHSFFSRDSMLWWVITTYQIRRRQYQALFNSPQYANLEYIQFTNPRQAELFIHHISND
jgi:adenylate kinase family enzyme